MTFKKLLLPFVLLAAFAGLLSAQSSPAAFTPRSIYVGAEPATMNPDWGCQKSSPFSCWNRQLVGAEAYPGANNIWRLIGAEADIRIFNWRGVGGGMKEDTYAAGPTVRIIGHQRFMVAANVLFGLGSITLPPNSGPGQGTYFIAAPSLRFEQHIVRRINLRYEYEYQMWPGFAGLLGNHGLTPNGIGVGVTYRLRATR
jgi:hypothetical protein